MMFELLAALATGASVGMLALLAVRSTVASPAALRIRQLAERPADNDDDDGSAAVMRRSRSSLPFLRRALDNSPRAARWEREIAQAGLKLRPGEYLMLRGGSALLALIIVAAIARSPAGFFAGLAAALTGFMLPSYWLSYTRKRRIEQVSKQLPEALTLMANALKAGFAFQHGISMAAEQLEPPISEEFTRVMVDLNIGSSVEESLYAMRDRVDSEDMNLLVTAIMVQRQSGGNLAEILDNVGDTVRERERLTGEVKTMTSQQRFSGMVLTVWPLFILGIFALFNWHQTKLLFTTGIGLVLLAIAAAGQVLGFFTIRKILDVDI
jgi:tight adherence protein B